MKDGQEEQGREGVDTNQGPDTLVAFVRNSKGCEDTQRTRSSRLSLLRCSFQKKYLPGEFKTSFQDRTKAETLIIT